MDDGFGGQFTTIYDGSFDTGTLNFLKSGLTEGLHYTFRAFSLNFNGKSQPSQTASYYACTAPSGFQKPAITEQTQSYITINWQPPKDDGACRILSYAVYRDDGASGPITTEVNAD